MALTRYGIPSRVYLVLTVGAPCIGVGNFPDYEMWVAYEGQDVAFVYRGPMLRDNEQWLVCPAGSTLRDVRVHRRTPGANQPLVEVDANLGPDFFIYGNLGDLSGMALEQFHKAFGRADPQSCIAVPRRYWDEEGTPVEVDQPLRPARSLSEEDIAWLMDMLVTNGGCELPCWWGLTPGETRWQEAERFFLSRDRTISSWEAEGLGTGNWHRVSLFGRFRPYPFDYVVEHLIYEQEGVVQVIGVHGHALRWFAIGQEAGPPAQYLAQDWARFSLSQVLTDLGQPSQVLLHYWPEGEGSLYSVGVLYEERGVLVEYMGLVQRRPDDEGYIADPVLICLTDQQLTDINLWLRPPGGEPSLTDLFAQVGGGYLTLLSYRVVPTLEEATGTSLAAFYETYRDPGSQNCLEAAGSLGDYYP